MKFCFYILICFFLLSCSTYLKAQIGINKIFQHNVIALTYTESLWLNDTLVVVGTYVDSSGRIECILNFINKSGEIELTLDNIDTSDIYSYAYFSKGLSYINDTIYQIGYKQMVFDSTPNGVKLYCVLNKFDHGGAKIFESEFRGKYYPNEHFASPNDYFIDSNNIFLTYSTWEFLKEKHNARICISKLDLNGNIVWDECFGDLTREKSHEILVTTAKEVIVIGESNNLYQSNDYQGSGNGFWRGYIFKTDSLGNLEWEWRSPSLFESADAALLTSDSTIIVAASYGIEYCDVPKEPLSWCSIYWTGGVYKMNLETRNKIWETSLSAGPHTTKRDNQYYDIIPSIEKDGYILCGSGYNLAYEGCQQIDTQKCWFYPGIIAKVSNEGDSLWLRKYFGVTDLWESNIFFDIEATDDSLYSLVGEAFNPFPGETQGTHGWVLVTDKYGCLIPGCHLISSNEDSEEKNELLSSPMKIYPNPAIDVVNVLITTKLSSKATLHLINNLGQEIDSWQNFEIGATYIIPVGHYTPGTYIMTMTQDNSIIDSKVVIIH